MHACMHAPFHTYALHPAFLFASIHSIPVMFFFARAPPHLLPVKACTFARTFARSPARSVARSVVRTHVRSHVRSYVRTHVRSYVRSYVRTFGRTFARTFARVPPFRTFVRTYNPPSFNTSKNALKSSLATF